MRKKLTKLFDKKSYEILKFKKEQQLQEQKLKQESSQQSQQSHDLDQTYLNNFKNLHNHKWCQVSTIM